MRSAWVWTLVLGGAAVLCLALGLSSGFAAILIGSDEALAARPFMAAAMILLFVGVLLLTACGGALVNAVRTRGT